VEEAERSAADVTKARGTWVGSGLDATEEAKLARRIARGLSFAVENMLDS
jgi:hypothetical protein